MTEYRGRTSVEAVKHLQPHPEEAAHRSRACPTSAILKCRNRQQPISMGGRPEALEGRRMEPRHGSPACPTSARRSPKSATADFGCSRPSFETRRKDAALLRIEVVVC